MRGRSGRQRDACRRSTPRGKAARAGAARGSRTVQPGKLDVKSGSGVGRRMTARARARASSPPAPSRRVAAAAPRRRPRTVDMSRLVHDAPARRRPRVVLPPRRRSGPPRFTIVGGGSDAGIADAARGIVDIGLASRGAAADRSRPASSSRRSRASGVCLVTNARQPAARADARAAGRSSWRRARRAGRRSPARRAQRRDPLRRRSTLGTGARSVFFTTFVDPRRRRRTSPSARSRPPRQVRDYVRATPGGLELRRPRVHRAGCTSSRSRACGCTRATVADGTYPARRELAFVTRGAPARRGRALHPLGAHAAASRAA